MSEDKAIITLIEKNSGFEADFELPTEIKMKDISESLKELLQELSPRIFEKYREIILTDNVGHVLEPDDTLASRGLWSGSILSILEG